MVTKNKNKLISKSIRLTPEEAKELTESALMRRWVLEGLAHYKLEKAIAAYMRREVSIGEGAAMAGVSYNRFEQELWNRRIVVLEDPQFLQTLASLGESFGRPQMPRAVRAVEQRRLKSE